MRTDSAITAPLSPDQTAQQRLRDLFDGKLRAVPTGPERLGDILKRIVPIFGAACAEPDELSQKTKPR